VRASRADLTLTDTSFTNVEIKDNFDIDNSCSGSSFTMTSSTAAHIAVSFADNLFYSGSFISYKGFADTFTISKIDFSSGLAAYTAATVRGQSFIDV